MENEESIFAAAIGHATPEARNAFLDAACAENLDLRARIEGLLWAHEHPDSFLNAADDLSRGQQGSGPFAPTITGPLTNMPTGTTIGPYKLLQQIGEGGMGTVYMAEQTEPVQRKVALKLIKAGMDSRQVISRFEAERQALALMDHPHIAKVLDAGSTEAGLPYFVMELVKGVPITKYCDEHHLTPRERLELFIPVCQAVQHAHQKGIIHRDLKPSNVMVALYDGKPVPKVIDFGVAKATGQRLTDKTLFTGLGTIVGTVEYMSPEQAEINQLDIDTRSDIYSLGVLLYELLTGSPPFTKKDLEQAGLLEMMRLIREQEPSKPSTKLSTADGLPTLAANRGTEPAKLTKLVRGELDWIVMKALEKDRSRRYETANGFALDVHRYLSDEPVMACPPSAGYRLRKFVRRNKGPVLAASLVTLALVAGVVGTTLGMLRATKAEADAKREAGEKTVALGQKEAALATAEANEIQAIAAQKEAQENLQHALAAVDQMLTRVADDKLIYVPQMEQIRRELLLDALRFYEKFLEKQNDDPVVRREAAFAYQRVGRIHNELGQYQDAERAFRKAFEIFDDLGPTVFADPALLREMVACHIEFSWPLGALGKNEEARQSYRRAVEIADKLDRKDPANRHCILNIRNGWAAALTSQQPDEAEKMLKDNLTLADDAYSLEAVYRGLGCVFRITGRLTQAEEAFGQAVKCAQQVAADSPSANWVQACLANDLRELAGMISRNMRPTEAEETLGRAILILDRLATDFPSGPGYRKTLADVLTEDAGLQKQLGRTADAERSFRRAIDLYEKLAKDFPTMPTYSQTTFELRLDLGQFLKESARIEEAIGLYRDADSIVSKLPADAQGRFAHWVGLARTQIDLGLLLAADGKNEEADAAYRESLAIRDRLEKEFADKAEFRRDLAGSHLNMAYAQKKARRSDEAIKSFQMALSHGEKLAAEFPGDTGYRNQLAFAHQELAILLPRQQDETEFRRALGIFEKLVSETHGEHAEYLQNLGHSRRWLAFCVWNAGNTKEAEELFGKALNDFEKLSAGWPDVAMYQHFLADTLRQIGVLLALRKEFLEAEKSYRRAVEIHEQRLARFPDQPVSQRDEEDLRLREAAGSYFDLAALLAATGRKQEAESVLRKFLLLPKNLQLATLHGRAYAELEEWQNAAAAFEQATTLTPDSPLAWYFLALVHLQRGDHVGYRMACSRMLARFGQSASADDAYWLVWTCVLGPDAVADWTKLLKLVEKTHAEGGKDYDALNHLGAVLYRAGRIDEAAQALTDAEAAFQQIPSMRSTIAYNWLIQAMTQHRLGHTVEAASWLKKAVQDIDDPSPKTAQDRAKNAWNRRLTLQLLRREAEELLKKESGVTNQKSDEKSN
jgi:serine/threonine protein kinase/tetratricopeptide (TPR) repeat protein